MTLDFARALTWLAIGFVVSSCGDDDRMATTDAGALDAARVDAGSVDAAGRDASSPSDAGPAPDGALPTDAGPAADGGSSTCTSPRDCVSDACSSNRRCASWTAELIDEVTPVGHGLAADVRGDGRISVAYDDAVAHIHIADESGATWTVRDTMLTGALLAYAPDPDRIAACASDGRLFVSQWDGATWSTRFATLAPTCTDSRFLDARFRGTELDLAWSALPAVNVLHDAGGPTEAVEPVATLDATVLAVSVPRLGDDASWLGFAMTVPPRGAFTMPFQEVHLAERGATGWTESRVYSPGNPIMGCVARNMGATWMIEQNDTTDRYGVTNDTSGAWTTTFSSGWRNTDFRCGTLPLGPSPAGRQGLDIAATQSDSTLQLYVFFEIFDSWRNDVTVTPARFGCAVGNQHQVVRDASGDDVLITFSSTTAADTGPGCRVTAFRLRDD